MSTPEGIPPTLFTDVSDAAVYAADLTVPVGTTAYAPLSQAEVDTLDKVQEAYAAELRGGPFVASGNSCTECFFRARGIAHHHMVMGQVFAEDKPSGHRVWFEMEMIERLLEGGDYAARNLSSWTYVIRPNHDDPEASEEFMRLTIHADEHQPEQILVWKLTEETTDNLYGGGQRLGKWPD